MRAVVCLSHMLSLTHERSYLYPSFSIETKPKQPHDRAPLIMSVCGFEVFSTVSKTGFYSYRGTLINQIQHKRELSGFPPLFISTSRGVEVPAGAGVKSWCKHHQESRAPGTGWCSRLCWPVSGKLPIASPLTGVQLTAWFPSLTCDKWRQK